MKIGKKSINHLCLQTVIVYIENPKGSTKKNLPRTNKGVQQGNTQKIIFFYTITTNN